MKRGTLVVVLLVTGFAYAQTSPPAGPPTTAPGESTKEESARPASIHPFALDGATMTDNWFGLGKAMNSIGIDMKYYWNSTFMSVYRGGRNTGGLKPASSYDWFLTLDLDKMGVLKDADILVQTRGQWSYSVNGWTGSTMQVSDDNDAKNWDMYIDQLWYRQHFLDRKIALQLGYLDFQTIVDRNEYANSEDKQFMNEALDNNPLFPTASATGLGAALTIKPCGWYTFLIGAGDAQRLPLYKPGFSTAFHDQAWFLGYMEHTLHTKFAGPKGPLTGNYRFGMVYDPLARNWETQERRGDDVGFYTSFDQLLLRENEKDLQGLGWFFRYAYRHRDVYRANEFWSTGLSYTGLLPIRDKDTLGLAMWQLLPSELYQSRVNRNWGAETGYELYYAIALTPWLVLTPDIQYIDNPGANDTVPSAIAGGFHLRVTF